MRNLVQYPITVEEIIQLLDTYSKNKDSTIGGTEGFILAKMKEYVLSNKENIETFMKVD